MMIQCHNIPISEFSFIPYASSTHKTKWFLTIKCYVKFIYFLYDR